MTWFKARTLRSPIPTALRPCDYDAPDYLGLDSRHGLNMLEESKLHSDTRGSLGHIPFLGFQFEVCKTLGP